MARVAIIGGGAVGLGSAHYLQADGHDVTIFDANGLASRTSLFRVQEASTTILVTDALALRVLHAGCTGVEFDDFGISKWGMHTGRLRTTTGIALHRVGYLD